MSTRRKLTRTELEVEVETFDWSSFDALTDAEIESAGNTDPDAVMPTDSDLTDAKLLVPVPVRRRGKQPAG